MQKLLLANKPAGEGDSNSTQKHKLKPKYGLKKKKRLRFSMCGQKGKRHSDMRDKVMNTILHFSAKK